MIKKYLKYNIIYVIALLYFFISIVLKGMNIVDMTVPCLFKTFFNISCLGCGLTSASIHILKLEFVKAFSCNPIIFIIIPLSLILLIKNYYIFKKNN